MDKIQLPPIDAKDLEQSLIEDFRQCISEVTQAVNQAHAGALIDESEQPVREATAKLRQKVFEKAIQKKTDAAQAAFSPSGQRKHKRPRSSST